MAQNSVWDPYIPDAVWHGFIENSNKSYADFCAYFNERFHLSQTKHHISAEFIQLRIFTNSVQNHQSHVSWGLYYFLCVAGGLYALCSGFDGMASLLALVMPELYMGLLIALGVLSALSALSIFIARDKPSIMETIELSYNPYHSLADEYLFSMQIFNDAKISEQIKNKALDFRKEETTAKLLKSILQEKAEHNQKIKQDWWVQIQANIVMMVGGILFFSDGFFVGENMAELIATLLAFNSCEMVLLTSIIMGLCALIAYWYVERSSLRTYWYDNVTTDDSLVEERTQVNEKNLEFLSYNQSRDNVSREEGRENVLSLGL